MDKTELGDRMKEYEKAEGGRRFLPLVPICARIDGRSFSKWTRDLERPYDERLSRTMKLTTRWLVQQTSALVGYTQSDEISLLFYSDSRKSSIFFDGRIQKMTSVLASMTTARFNALLPANLPDKADSPATFDCRAWPLPTRAEAANVFLWRELDATKNSISMAARHYYSHKQLMNKNSSEMQEMLFQKGVNWNDYPAFFKRGVFLQRKQVVRKFTVEELDKLPPKHEARKNPDLEITRHDVTELSLPPLRKITNRAAVLFDGAEPETADQAPNQTADQTADQTAARAIEDQ